MAVTVPTYVFLLSCRCRVSVSKPDQVPDPARRHDLRGMGGSSVHPPGGPGCPGLASPLPTLNNKTHKNFSNLFSYFLPLSLLYIHLSICLSLFLIYAKCTFSKLNTLFIFYCLPKVHFYSIFPTMCLNHAFTVSLCLVKFLFIFYILTTFSVYSFPSFYIKPYFEKKNYV